MERRDDETALAREPFEVVWRFDDTILTYARAVDDCRQGRVARAIDRVNRVIDQVPAYCERDAPDMTMAMLGQAYSTLVVARVLEAEMRHSRLQAVRRLRSES